MRFEIIGTPTNWVSVYETLTPAGRTGRGEADGHSHRGQPNQYQLSNLAGAGSTNAVARKLAPDQTMIPFAGSDFWVADLGLEFLHWPQQRLLKKEMRHSKSCEVLESVNPHPVPGGYARVVSWIIIESPHGIVHADAYDAQGELLKRFDPTNLEKIQGEYQLDEMEMRNRQTGSRHLDQVQPGPELREVSELTRVIPCLSRAALIRAGRSRFVNSRNSRIPARHYSP